jgi:hypothetical protein
MERPERRAGYGIPSVAAENAESHGPPGRGRPHLTPMVPVRFSPATFALDRRERATSSLVGANDVLTDFWAAACATVPMAMNRNSIGAMAEFAQRAVRPRRNDAIVRPTWFGVRSRRVTS